MGLFGTTCICGKNVERGVPYCPHCSQMMPCARRICPHCEKENPGDASGCMYCGRKFAASGSSLVWKRGPKDFATRVDLSCTELYECGELVVEQGTRALLFVDGRFVEVLGPGRFKYSKDELPPGPLARLFHALDWRPGHKLQQRLVTAVLLDAADCVLEFKGIAGILTSDPLRMTVDARMVLRIEDPARFFENVMKSRTNYTLDDLHGDLLSEVHNALADAVGKYKAAQLNAQVELKREFEAHLEHHLRNTFGRNGYSFEQVRTLNFMHPGLDKVLDIREQYVLLVTQQEAINAGHKRLFDAKNERELQNIYEETKKVENYEKRAAVMQRLRLAMSEDKMAEVKTADDLEAFIDHVDRGKLIREEERLALKRGFEDRKEDHAYARAFLLKKLEIERSLELMQIAKVGEKKLSEQLIEIDIRIERAKRDADIAAADKQHAVELQRKAREEEQRLILLLNEAKTVAQVESIKIDIRRRKLELAFWAKRENEAIKEAREQAAMVRRLDEKRRDAEIRLMELKAKIEQALLFGPAGILMLMDDGARTAFVQYELIQRAQGMTVEQIAALQSGNSTAAAEALKKYFESKSVDAQKEMYERMIKLIEAQNKELAAVVRGAMEQSLAGAKAVADVKIEEADKRASDVKEAYSQANNNIAAVAAEKAAAGQDVSCPKCRKNYPSGAASCPNCR